MILFVVFGCSYFLFARAATFATAIAWFLVMHGILAVARTSLGVRLNELLPSTHRAAILSTVGLISRVGMMSALALIGHMLGDATRPLTLPEIMRWFSMETLFAIGLILIGIYLTKILRRNKIHGTNLSETAA